MTDVRDSSNGGRHQAQHAGPALSGTERSAAENAVAEHAEAERAAAESPGRSNAVAEHGGFPVRRQPTARLVGPGGRHRRPVPATLPEGSPALILAVPSTSDDCLTGIASEIRTIIGLDNPALDVQLARVDTVSTVLAEAAQRRPPGTPAAVVVPLLTTPYAAATDAIRAAITASGASALVAHVFNTNALLAEALHIRLADAGLARADRVRMFSITTSADGIIVATVGGTEGVGAASVTAILLAARLALPVVAASLDGTPGIEQGAMHLQAMGVTRVAIAPCIVGPEASPGAIEEAAAMVGAKCAAPLGAHDNVVKLISQAYGHALSRIEPPAEA